MVLITQILILSTSALSLRSNHHVVQHEDEKSHKMVKVGGCTENPGAGMATSGDSATVYKDGYWFVACMMDRMEKDADYHNEMTREHEYTSASAHANVSIVRYTDRIGREEQQPMTPSVCFNFCRTVPEMLFFGLAYGRECYCTPYYHKTTGDGACSAQCEGDATKTCGNENGMADMYQMHSCGAGDTVATARDDVSFADQVVTDAKGVSQDATGELNELDSKYADVLEEERAKLQESAKVLAALLRPVDAEVAECEAQEDALRSTLDGVAADTSVISEVLDIEEKQTELNACVARLEAAVKVLKKELEDRARYVPITAAEARARSS